MRKSLKVAYLEEVDLGHLEEPVDSAHEVVDGARRPHSCDGIVADLPWIAQRVEEPLDLRHFEARRALVIGSHLLQQIEYQR